VNLIFWRYELAILVLGISLAVFFCLWRRHRLLAGKYELPSGINIWFGKKLHFIKPWEYNRTITNVILLWNKKAGWPLTDMWQAVNKTDVFILEREKIIGPGEKGRLDMYAMAWRPLKLIYIMGGLSPNLLNRRQTRHKVMSRLAHEISHIIAWEMVKEPKSNKEHEWMRYVGVF
jgi:hypothetical protein